MICDGHLHYFVKKHVRNYESKKIPVNVATLPLNHRNLVDKIKRQSIVKANLLPLIVLPHFNCLEKLVQSINEEICNVVSYYPHIFTGFLLLDDRIDKVLLDNDLIRGVKLHFYINNIQKDVEERENIFSILEHTEKFIVLHEGSKEKLTPKRLLEKKLRTLKLLTLKYPKIRIIVAHSGRTRPFTSNGIEEFLTALFEAKIPMDNLYFDTSTIRSLEGINILIKRVGVEKIIFGSDYPYCKDETEDVFKEEISAFKALDSDKKKAIFCQNYQKLFFPKGWWIRRVLKEDGLLKFLLQLPQEEQTFLALSQKKDVISKLIREEHLNMFVLESFKQGICGFMRFSDRYNSGVFLEELVIFPKFRGLGYAKSLLNKLKMKAKFIETKVLSRNKAMKNLLQNSGFIEIKKGKRVTWWIWKRKLEES